MLRIAGGDGRLTTEERSPAALSSRIRLNSDTST
jgi:hypothetical protein